jgi:hypothetical protein
LLAKCRCTGNVVLDLSTGQSTQLPAMITPRFGFAITVINDTTADILVCGGYRAHDIAFLYTCEQFNNSTIVDE